MFQTTNQYSYIRVHPQISRIFAGWHGFGKLRSMSSVQVAWLKKIRGNWRGNSAAAPQSVQTSSSSFHEIGILFRGVYNCIYVYDILIYVSVLVLIHIIYNYIYIIYIYYIYIYIIYIFHIFPQYVCVCIMPGKQTVVIYSVKTSLYGIAHQLIYMYIYIWQQRDVHFLHG